MLELLYLSSLVLVLLLLVVMLLVLLAVLVLVAVFVASSVGVLMLLLGKQGDACSVISGRIVPSLLTLSKPPFSPAHSHPRRDDGGTNGVSSGTKHPGAGASARHSHAHRARARKRVTISSSQQLLDNAQATKSPKWSSGTFPALRAPQPSH